MLPSLASSLLSLALALVQLSSAWLCDAYAGAADDGGEVTSKSSSRRLRLPPPHGGLQRGTDSSYVELPSGKDSDSSINRVPELK